MDCLITRDTHQLVPNVTKMMNQKNPASIAGFFYAHSL